MSIGECEEESDGFEAERNISLVYKIIGLGVHDNIFPK